MRTVETREYPQGQVTLVAKIQDNATVLFGVVGTPEFQYAGVSSRVLRQLADLADTAKVPTP